MPGDLRRPFGDAAENTRFERRRRIVLERGRGAPPTGSAAGMQRSAPRASGLASRRTASPPERPRAAASAKSYAGGCDGACGTRRTVTAPRDPEELGASATPTPTELSPRTSMGAVHLTVSDRDRSVAYSARAVGLSVLGGEGRSAALGTAERELLVLVEERGARPAAGYTGLYHFALLLPARADLARWLAHAAQDRVPLTGLSDHFVSEALYLSDPDGHGIEIYWDRPRETWEGQVAARMTTLPLDVDSLMAELDEPGTAPFDGLAAGTVMGHVHLKVAEVDGTVRFYRDALGFGLMAQLGPHAAFLAAGGYHHHLGANTWESAGAAPPPEGSARLLHATIVLPDGAERDRAAARLEQAGRPVEEGDGEPAAVDPSGNVLVLAVAS